MPERLKSFLVPCIAAMASVGSALLLTLRIPPPPGRAVPTVSGRVAVSFRFGGMPSGVLATLLSVVASGSCRPFMHGFGAILPLSSFISSLWRCF